MSLLKNYLNKYMKPCPNNLKRVTLLKAECVFFYLEDEDIALKKYCLSRNKNDKFLILSPFPMTKLLVSLNEFIHFNVLILING